MGCIQGVRVHANGRAEIGHRRAELDSTQALALVHAGPSMRCRWFSLGPLFPSIPQSVITGPPPFTLLPPALALQKRNTKGWGSKTGAGACSVWGFVPLRSAAN